MKRRAELYGEIEFATVATRMLRSKRKKLENGDGCLDAESAAPGDIANAFLLQNGKHTQMELSQEISEDNTDQLEILEEGEDEQDEQIDEFVEN